MEGYIIILGRNWKLSLAELSHMLTRPEFEGRILDYSQNAAYIEFNNSNIKEESLDRLIYYLGGSQKIVKAVDFIENDLFLDAFPDEIDEKEPGKMIEGRRSVSGFFKDIIYPIFGRIQKSEAYFIANSIYPVSFNDSRYKLLLKHFLPYINKEWMKNLKQKGARKAQFFRYPEEKIKSGKLNPIFPHHFMTYELYLPTKKEIVYAFTKKGVYIGYTINVVNSNEMKMLDEERPYKKKEALIPPKFAKILINLLDLKFPYQSNKILDPFCGSGTILMFATTMGIKVFGSDKSKDAVNGTKANIRWLRKLMDKPPKIDFEKQFKQTPLEKIAETFADIKFDGIVTEPILLPYFKSLPQFSEIDSVINEKIIPVYEEMFKTFPKILKEHGRVALTSASIETMDGGPIKILLKDIAENNGFKQVKLLQSKVFSKDIDTNLSLRTKDGMIFDTSSKYLRRLFYCFELK